MNGRLLCDLTSVRGDPALVATDGSGAIVAWTDLRGIDADIFAIQVLAAAPVQVPGPDASGIIFLRPTPNPARESLTLRFALPRETLVRLAIYDVAGRRVRELASGARLAGEQAIGWDLLDERGRAVGAVLFRPTRGGRALAHAEAHDAEVMGDSGRERPHDHDSFGDPGARIEAESNSIPFL